MKRLEAALVLTSEYFKVFRVCSVLAGYGAHTSGQWFSGNESVLSVDKTLGMARAVGEGSAQGTTECHFIFVD